jgi:hypothetical protein
MLFDLRSAGRRRAIKVVYGGLALLMFMGFVFFGIGSSGLGGSIGDLFGKSSGGSSNAAQNRLVTQVRAADRRTRVTPSDPAAWAADVQAHIRLAAVGDYFDPAKQDFTAAGKAQLTQAGAAWDRYLALNPAKPDENLARQMIQTFLSISKPDKAVSAQEILTEIDPTQQTFQNLAILSYQAGNTRKGDLAAGKAVDLAPAADRKDLKKQLDTYKSQAAVQQIQQGQPTPTATIG